MPSGTNTGGRSGGRSVGSAPVRGGVPGPDDAVCHRPGYQTGDGGCRSPPIPGQTTDTPSQLAAHTRSPVGTEGSEG